VSERFPTVEVRCADVQLRVDETVMLAGLVRARVTVALWEMADGVDSPVYEPELIRAAVWAAARNGVDGDLYDLGQGRRRRAGDVLCDLLDRTEPALALADDSAQVHKLLDRLLGEGTGSSRQRAYVRANGLPRLVEMLAAETVSAWP
jgi:carboxylate-amine ligase